MSDNVMTGTTEPVSSIAAVAPVPAAGGLLEKLSHLEQWVADHVGRVGNLETDVATAVSRIEELAAKVAHFEGQLSGVLPHVGEIGAVLTTLDKISAYIEKLQRGVNVAPPAP